MTVVGKETCSTLALVCARFKGTCAKTRKEEEEKVALLVKVVIQW